MSKISKTEEKAIREFKTQLSQKLGKDIISIQLFGSKARGDFHKESDVDVLIVLKRKMRKSEDFIIGLTTDLALKYGVNISPIILSRKDYNYQKRLPSIFIQILQREAISL